MGPRTCCSFAFLLVALLGLLVVPASALDNVIGSKTVNLYATADATVNLSNPDANYGSQASLEVHIDSYLSYAYMMFDLSSIPPNAEILSAYLKAYLSYFTGYVSSLGVHRSMDTSWTESGITWNNKPSFAADPTSNISFRFGLVISGYKSWDVIPDARSALAAGKLTEVLLFEWSDLHTHVRFNSKEGQSRPYLQVNYLTAPICGVHVESVQDTGETSNLGSISIAVPIESGSVTYPLALPQDVDVMAGSYNVTYNGGYSFVRWDTTGGVSVADPYAQSTVLTVTGSGTIKAVGSARQIQYFYDDGFYDDRVGSSKKPGEMVAVRFTPLVSDKLLAARFYFAYAYNHTIKVHVMDVTLTDLIPPFDQTVLFAKGYTTQGWYDVDLSGYGLMLTAGTDFYIGMEWTRESYPELGIDRASPIDERSWSRNATGWAPVTGADYMIRAILGAKSASSLSCSVSPASITIGSGVRVSGSLIPVHAGAAIMLTYTRSNGTIVGRTVMTDVNGMYSDTYKPDAAGLWSVAASWAGDEDHEGAQSSAVTCTVAKASSSISCSSFTNTISIGSSITVTGYISPIHGGAVVALTYTRPDASIVARTVTATSSAYYTDTYAPDRVGSWTVWASWTGDHDHEGATSPAKSIVVNKASSSITCRASATVFSIGLSTVISGVVSPADSALEVFIQQSTDAGSTWNNLTSVMTNPSGSYSSNWTPSTVGSYVVRSTWAGDEGHIGATSYSQSITVLRGSSSLFCAVSPGSISVGSAATISGSISPAQTAMVTMLYSNDGGASWLDLATVEAQSDGSYSHVWVPPNAGSYQIKASWPGDANRNGAQSPTRGLTVAAIAEQGLLALVAAVVLLALKRRASISSKVSWPAA